MPKTLLPNNLIFKTFSTSYGKVKFQYQKYYFTKKIKKFFQKHNFEDIDNLNLYSLEQVHKDKIAIVNPQKIHYPNSDAFITNEKKLILTLRHADCFPVLIFEPAMKVLGLVHSGWKGTESDIVLKTVQKMINRFSVKPENLIIKIGPGAKKCCYKFEKKWPHATLLKDENWSNFIVKKRKYYYLDLESYIINSLLQIGLNRKNIHTSSVCTICNKRYFSWTRRRKRRLAPQNNLSVAFIL